MDRILGSKMIAVIGCCWGLVTVRRSER